MAEDRVIGLLNIRLLPQLRHSLYAFSIVFIPSTNLIQSAACLIGAASRYTGPLHQQTIVKL
jgi:hypothetical protein